MKTVATNDAKTNLSRYLNEVSEGQSIVIARGRTPIAKLVPYRESESPRPKVGDTMDAPIHIPDEAFEPMSRSGLDAWGI